MHYARSTLIPRPASEVYAWHARPGAFERLAPSWQRLRVLERHGTIQNGATLSFAMGPRWLPLVWKARHVDHEVGRSFVDVAEQSPFAAWRHTHRFDATADGGCDLVDSVDLRLPGPALLTRLAEPLLRRLLDRMFAQRHETTRREIMQHARRPDLGPMKVAISGASGLVGRGLATFLSTGGHEVYSLVRRPAQTAHEIAWNPEAGEVDRARLEGVDVVVHLAGENIASGRWTDEQKLRIRESRVLGTQTLSRAIAALDRKPHTFVSASAVGAYGCRSDEELDEESPRGEGFLAEVCAAWEGAASPAADAGVRVVHPRFGMILHPQEGALAKMVLPTQLGVGGRMGSGQQWWSWVTLEDALALLLFAMEETSITGALNVVAPEPLRAGAFADTLARALRRPAPLPAPAFALRLALGEMADALLLCSARAVPRKALAAGFTFTYPDLESALRFQLGRTRPT